MVQFWLAAHLLIVTTQAMSCLVQSAINYSLKDVIISESPFVCDVYLYLIVT